MGEFFAAKRSEDEATAFQKAIAVNEQLYGQARGDFADQLALMDFNNTLDVQKFSQMMQAAGET